jgi:hypothetical protein
MKDYFKRLKDHPGIGVATIMTIMGFCAGASNKSLPPEKWWYGGLFGMLAMGIVVWSCVLISNIDRSKKSVWIIGTCNGILARKHRKKKNVQMKLFQAGEHGHKEDYWHNFDSSWWNKFIPNK